MSKDLENPSQPRENPKIAVVVVTHGHLAGELLAAAEMIVGPISHIAAVSMSWHDDVDAARGGVERSHWSRFLKAQVFCLPPICLVAHRLISPQCFTKKAWLR